MHIQPLQSPRGFRRSALYSLTLAGVIKGNDQYDLTAKIGALIDAHQEDGHDVGLYHDDGTPTRHVLISNRADSITGVRVVRRSWPIDEPGEYATQRHYVIEYECEYLESEFGTDLQFFHEQLIFIGNTGPRFRIQEYLDIPPRRIDMNRYTAQRIIQKGRAVGLQTYPFIYVPGPIFPDVEHLDQRVIAPFGGTRYRNRILDFGVSWTYHFTSPTYLEALPNSF